jgi:hypothetical protein
MCANDKEREELPAVFGDFAREKLTATEKYFLWIL